MPYTLSQYQYGVPASLTFQASPVPHRELTRRAAARLQDAELVSRQGPETDRELSCCAWSIASATIASSSWRRSTWRCRSSCSRCANTGISGSAITGLAVRAGYQFLPGLPVSLPGGVDVSVRADGSHGTGADGALADRGVAGRRRSGLSDPGAVRRRTSSSGTGCIWPPTRVR